MRAVVLMLGIAMLIGATACSGSEPAPTVLSPLPSAVASPSPSPVAAPSLPPAARGKTPAASSAFVRYYFDVLTDAFNRRDASAVRALSDPGCGGCRNLIGAIEAPDKPGETVEGGAFLVDGTASPPLEQGTTVVSLRYHVAAVRVSDATGSTLRNLRATKPINAEVRLRRLSDGWIVLGFRNV